VLAGLVYLVLSRSLDLTAEQAAIQRGEREPQAIDAQAEADAGATQGGSSARSGSAGEPGA
jgi:hypothetical protein